MNGAESTPSGSNNRRLLVLPALLVFGGLMGVLGIEVGTSPDSRGLYFHERLQSHVSVDWDDETERPDCASVVVLYDDNGTWQARTFGEHGERYNVSVSGFPPVIPSGQSVAVFDVTLTCPVYAGGFSGTVTVDLKYVAADSDVMESNLLRERLRSAATGLIASELRNMQSSRDL